MTVLEHSSSNDRKDVLVAHQIAGFFGLTLLIAWGVPVVVLFLARVFGFEPPVFSQGSPITAWSPALAASAVVLISRGLPGFKAFVGRLAQGRAGASWYVLALAGIPAACMIASTLASGHAGPDPGTNPGGWRAIAIAGLASLAATPIAELGLRGFAQPMLQRRHGAIEASVMIGVMWTVWLLPTFMLDPGFARPDGPAPDLQLAAFAARTIALSVILGVIYNRTHGSMGVCMLAHWTASLCFPDAGAAGELPAQALVLSALAMSLGVAMRGELRPAALERRVTGMTRA